MRRTYVELFAGAGGLSLGLDHAGWRPIAHAEIERHARAVLRDKWPFLPLHGDVREVDWTQYRGAVDLVAGGSPCQDLSIAGKRSGLAGERSGLFYELVRAWNETAAPYCLWENVDGCRSSNNGRDFAAVLSAFVGANIDVPSDGWRTSGVAAGSAAVASWRRIDLAEFGIPHTRHRIFLLVSRTGANDPAEILGIGPCGVWRYPERKTFEASTRTATQSDDAASGYWCNIHDGDLFECGCLIASYCCSFCNEWTSGLFYEYSDGCTNCGKEFGEMWVPDRLGTLTDGAHQGGGTNGQDFYTGRIIVQNGKARRLTPIECERLMSWPDRWTEVGRDDNGTVYKLPDTARYKLCGNGVGSVCAEWIGQKLLESMEKAEKGY